MKELELTPPLGYSLIDNRTQLDIPKGGFLIWILQ